MDSKVKYREGDYIIEIAVRTETGAKEQFFRANMRDVKSLKAISRLLFDKYGVNLTPLMDEKGSFDFDF